MGLLQQVAFCLVVTSTVWAQHEDTPRTYYDARRNPEQGGMQYYYIPPNMYFNGRQQEMTYAQDPFFGFNGELPLPFSQDIFKPLPARKPQSSPGEMVNAGAYSERGQAQENEQAAFYIIPSEIELPPKVEPIPISPNPSPEDSSTIESAESASNSTEAPVPETTGPVEDSNSTAAEEHEASTTTVPPEVNGLSTRKSPRPFFTNAHHFPFPMGMRNEYKLQYQAMFPDAPVFEQETSFTPLESFGSMSDKPNQFMWLNPYSKKPGDRPPAFVDYDPSMLINTQQQQQPQQKPQLVYYFFNPQGNSGFQPQSVIPDMKPDQQQGPGFNNQPSSPVYMLFQPSEEDSFNMGPQPDKPKSSSISGRGGQNGQYVDVPLSFMSNSPQQQNRFYYVRPDLNRYVNDRV